MVIELKFVDVVIELVIVTVMRDCNVCCDSESKIVRDDKDG